MRCEYYAREAGARGRERENEVEGEKLHRPAA